MKHLVDYSKYPMVRFKSVHGIAIAEQPWPTAFLVTKDLIDLSGSGLIEVRPLTLRNFATALVQNWISTAWWRFQRASWRLGFLDVFDGRPVADAKWRLRFWLPREGAPPPR